MSRVFLKNIKNVSLMSFKTTKHFRLVVIFRVEKLLKKSEVLHS